MATPKRRNPRPTKSTGKIKAPSTSTRRAPAQPVSKIDAIIAALRSPKGANIAQLMTLTGWQAHSIRGALAGSIKKLRGLTVISEKSGDTRVYRIRSGS